MDKDLLIQNIIRCCSDKGEPPTNACFNAGVGKSFIANMRKGQTPSVAKVAELAAYLGVTTSDLVGDNVSRLDTSGPVTSLVSKFEQLNPEGQEKLLDYADDLVLSGKYIKNHPNRVDKEA